jgi:outer membrane protein
MKRSFVVVCSFLVLGIVSGVQAQAPANAGQAEHIATVNFTAAVLQTTEGRREFGALQTKYAPRQAQLQTLNGEVEALRKQLSSDSKQTDAEKQTREKTLDTEEKQLQRQAEDFRNDSEAESQQVYQRIAQKMYAFLQTYVQQRGFTVVIDRGSDTAPVVWYAAKGVDITDELIKAYDARAGATTGSRLDETPPAHNPPGSLPTAPSPH